MDALAEGPVKDSLKKRLDKVTTSEVTVNDADSNGKADDVDSVDYTPLTLATDGEVES
ncbi:GA-like domain-containing protein [Enterococcus faecalis]|uniref:GA-like domain-containing protein n=1 Tax=Enterococcus faecalis TaxID=1351 RepID=UPI0030C7C5D4